MTRDRDTQGRPRNARPRDALGRPLARAGRTQPPEDEPALAPPLALERAQQLLDTGAAFAAHEVLEAVWKATAGDERALWRGLAQLCVGVTHAQRGNPAGARALLDRAADTLAAAPTLHGVDPQRLAGWARLAATRPADLPAPPRLSG
ncbi:MAG TPA: DUF309 domain-containing protein [Mycobacteriales bacterium]|nr:DUF309 domain-containing protein [Mycobacteriales bacterium]